MVCWHLMMDAGPGDKPAGGCLAKETPGLVFHYSMGSADVGGKGGVKVNEWRTECLIFAAKDAAARSNCGMAVRGF